MAVVYATEVLSKIDERFYLDSVTKTIVNNGIEFEFSHGNNACTIYQVGVVTENDYVRSGTMRYGSLVELGNAVQTVVLSQDKSVAMSIDAGNREDSKMTLIMDEAVKRQVREVSVPTTDIYRLGILTTYAIANSQSATAAITAANAFTKILAGRTALINAKVKLGNIVCYVTAEVEAFLWLDPLFKSACDKRTADVATGQIGTIMGMDIIVVPSTYFVANFGFMLVGKDVLAAPTKFNKIKVLDGDSFGIDGLVAFLRRYYDAFIATNKGVGIFVQKIA